MRYRRFSYRYTEVHRIGSSLVDDPWKGRVPLFAARPQWRPPFDLYETGAALSVKVEVAGMDEEDFEITLYDDILVVEGVRPWKHSDKETRFFTVEIHYGPFRLEVPVPIGIDREHVTAQYEKGYLLISLPKAEAER